jgi:putative hydrolase of HD superfamily
MALRLLSARCIKMAIVHDLAESLVGDITPHDGG